ncbi:hypothetical protein QR680_019042 [Steinernema hermaphroditum]|uniref:Uncharacterized protein n=1 Tax=Steinernema hermaphroditum TaxID=289476 RepID=A0AA39HKR7_9BILA|nr:hypothetical protein QR680_019042 [Steinernema hermaphroditum]
MSRFAGKVAIVTGSSNGIGQAAAVLLASEGASVTIHGRSEEGLQTTEKLILEKGIPTERILSVQGDIKDDETIKELVERTLERFGKIDVLVNNAGIRSKPGMAEELVEQYDHIHDVNIKSIIKLNHLVEPHLEKTKGNIVNVSSVVAHVACTFYFYAMSKAALDHYMRSRTHELAKKGIRINNVNPGYIFTTILHKLGWSDDAIEKCYADVEKYVPLGRRGTVEEIGKAIAFLASEDASYITGVALLADGGLSQGHPL